MPRVVGLHTTPVAPQYVIIPALELSSQPIALRISAPLAVLNHLIFCVRKETFIEVTNSDALFLR